MVHYEYKESQFWLGYQSVSLADIFPDGIIKHLSLRFTAKDPIMLYVDDNGASVLWTNEEIDDFEEFTINLLLVFGNVPPSIAQPFVNLSQNIQVSHNIGFDFIAANLNRIRSIIIVSQHKDTKIWEIDGIQNKRITVSVSEDSELDYLPDCLTELLIICVHNKNKQALMKFWNLQKLTIASKNGELQFDIPETVTTLIVKLDHTAKAPYIGDLQVRYLAVKPSVTIPRESIEDNYFLHWTSGVKIEGDEDGQILAGILARNLAKYTSARTKVAQHD